MNNEISNMDWVQLFNKNSCEQNWTLLKQVYNDLICEKCVPYKNIKPGVPQLPTWLRNKEVVKAKKELRKAIVASNKSGLVSDKILFEEKHDQYNDTILKAKIAYESKLVDLQLCTEFFPHFFCY